MLHLATKFSPAESHSFPQAVEAGFTAAELWLSAELLNQADTLASRASQFPLRYALHFPNRGPITADQLQGAVRLYEALECSAMVIHQPMYALYGEALQRLSPNLRLGVENHDLRSATQLERWAQSSPWLTLDVEHLWQFTVRDGSFKKLKKTLISFLDDYADRLIHVHLPGYLPGKKVHRPQYCSRGMVRHVFTLLHERQFPGLVVSETAAKYQTPEDLRMDVLLFQRWRLDHQAQLQTTSASPQLARG